MALLHRALVSWFLFLIFLILLVVRLDQRTNWNWFIVFIPLWIFDGVVLTYFLFYLVNRCKNRNRTGGGGSGLGGGGTNSFSQLFCTEFLKRKIYMLVTVVFKMSTQILLCLRLANPNWNIPLYYIFIPIWSLLTFALVRVGINLHRRHRREMEREEGGNGNGRGNAPHGGGFRSSGSDSVTAATANLANFIQERFQRGARNYNNILHIQAPPLSGVPGAPGQLPQQQQQGPGQVQVQIPMSTASTSIAAR